MFWKVADERAEEPDPAAGHHEQQSSDPSSEPPAQEAGVVVGWVHHRVGQQLSRREPSCSSPPFQGRGGTYAAAHSPVRGQSQEEAQEATAVSNILLCQSYNYLFQ